MRKENDLIVDKKNNISFIFSGEPYSVITDDSPATIHAECVGCKRASDLRTCFHCEKPLCADCRGKHHEFQKKEVDLSVHYLTTKSDQLIILARKSRHIDRHLDIFNSSSSSSRGFECKS